MLGSSGVSAAPFCRLSLWPYPLLLFSRRGFLPWAFVRTWVGRLRSCLGSYLLLGELSFPCPGFSLGSSCRLVVQTPGIFLEPLLGFFPLASSVCCGLEVVQVNPWLSTLRSLAVEAVTLVLCQVLVGLPSWGYSASGFLGPVLFRVFPFVRGPLPQADAVGCGLHWSGRMPSLLTGRSCSFVLGSSSLDLVGVGGFHRVPSPLSSFGMWSPFRVNSVFCHD